MSGKPPHDGGDDALWQWVTRDVQRRPNNRIGVPIHQPKHRAPPLDRHAMAARDMETNIPPGRTVSGATPIKVRLSGGLDGHWETAIRRGRLVPDATLDLHGMTRDKAYDALVRFMGQAVRRRHRVLLVITGKGGPKPQSALRGQDRPQGVLRQLLPDWLAHGPHAQDIVGVRSAHQRHGGGGAAYVILKRPRNPAAPK